MRKAWNKPIHGKRRPTKPYDAAEVKFILAERAKQPPTSWERLGRAMDRHPMSVQDKFYRLEKEQQAADREPPPIAAKAVWPKHARFDINGRTFQMKPLYETPRRDSGTPPPGAVTRHSASDGNPVASPFIQSQATPNERSSPSLGPGAGEGRPLQDPPRQTSTVTP